MSRRRSLVVPSVTSEDMYLLRLGMRERSEMVVHRSRCEHIQVQSFRNVCKAYRCDDGIHKVHGLTKLISGLFLMRYAKV